MSVERLGPTVFRVIPAEKNKKVRIVEFFLEGRDGDADAQIDCFAEGSLVSCEANSCRLMCSHVAAAVNVLLNQNN